MNKEATPKKRTKITEAECKCETQEHINKVAEFLFFISQRLITRGFEHDKSKLEPAEVELFTKYTPKLKDVTYNSREYKKFLKELKPALDHHYAKNRHHPEHFSEGIKDMNLIDIIEMLCDWKASSMRHHDGNILKSIDVNQERFGYSDELKQIFLNTVKLFEEHK